MLLHNNTCSAGSSSRVSSSSDGALGWICTALHPGTWAVCSQFSQSLCMHDAQKHDRGLTSKHVLLLVEFPIMEWRDLEPAIVWHAIDDSLLISFSPTCQKVRWISLLLVPAYEEGALLEKPSCKYSTHWSAFCSCLSGFRICSIRKARFTTAPAPSHSPTIASKNVQ